MALTKVTSGVRTLGTGEVVTANINDDDVTAAKMADDAVGVAQLSATGTASATTFLRGDNAWSAVDSLPTQTSKDGYTLITDGTDASWTPRPNVNFLMNGTFEVAQRGTSFTPTTGSGASLMYTLDRWYGYRSTSTAIMQQISDGSSPDGFRCHARMGRTDSTSDAGYFIIGQQIETKNACALAGQTVCLSMWVKKHANFSGDWGIYVTTGTGSDESAWDSIGGGWTGGASAYSNTTIFSDVTTSWVRRSISLSIPSGVKEIAIKNHFSSFSGASVTNDYVEVAGMQLEIGSVPSAFNHKTYGQELADCQRYYEKVTTGSTGGGYDTTDFVTMFQWMTPKRVAPTLTQGGVLSVTKFGVTDYTQSSTSMSINGAGRNDTMGAQLHFGNFTSLTGDTPIGVNINTTFYIKCDAEL